MPAVSYRHVVFIDSECLICNQWAQFILVHDKSKSIAIAPLSSRLGQEAKAALNLPPDDTSTVIFVSGPNYFTKSTAILRIGMTLGSAYAGIALLGLLVPKVIRDWIYLWVAKRRHHLGSQNQCSITPRDPELARDDPRWLSGH